MKEINLENILLFSGSLSIILSITLSKGILHRKYELPKTILNTSLMFGISLCLISFILAFPLSKSNNFQNNRLISGNYLDKLRNESKLQAITKELIKNKFSKNDTIFFKGRYTTEKSFFAVITIYKYVITDTIISFAFTANFTNKTNRIKSDKNIGSINLSTHSINFGTNQGGKVVINDFGKLQIISLLKKDSWEYVEF